VLVFNSTLDNIPVYSSIRSSRVASRAFISSKRHKKRKLRDMFLVSVCPFPYPSNFTVVNAKVTLHIEIYSERMLEMDKESGAN